MTALLRFIAKVLAVVGVAAVVRSGRVATPDAARPDVPPTLAAATGQGRAADGPLAPGWSRPKPEKTPPPTYWPAVFALGITFFAWGLISNLFVLGAGLIIFIIGLAGWIGDLLHEG